MTSTRTAWRLAGLAAGALLLGACTSQQFRANANAPTYPPYDGEVAVVDVLPPAGQFERLGVVVVTGGNVGSDERMLTDLKRAAARAGANAVMLQQAEVKDVGLERKLGAWALRIER